MFQAADTARNILSHSLYVEDQGKIVIQMVKGNWEEVPEDVEAVNRALNPEVAVVDRAFLAKQRRAVDVAIRQALRVDRAVGAVLKALNEKRATEADWDRRSRPHSAAATPSQ